MASIGLKYMVAAPLAEDGSGYETGSVIAKAIDVDMNIGAKPVPLWADDSKVDTVFEFESGTIKIGGDYISFETRQMLLGNKYVAGEGDEPDQLISGINDDGKFVGVGFYSTTRISRKSMYRAIWLVKNKFRETGESLSTKSGGTSFQTPTLEGEILTTDDGTWRIQALLETEAKAIEWLNAKAMIS